MAGAAGQHLRGAHRRRDPRLGAERGPGACFPGLRLRTVSGGRRGVGVGGSLGENIPRVPRYQNRFARICTCFRRAGGRKGPKGDLSGLGERRPVVRGSSREGSARKATSWTDACGRVGEAQTLCSHPGSRVAGFAFFSSICASEVLPAP